MWGGGAACWAIASEYYNNVPPLAYLSVKWTSWHKRLLDVVIGDPAHQGTFEDCTSSLLAVAKWVNESTRGRVIVVGDALGAMHGVITLSAKSETVYTIAMELALHLAPLCLTMAGILRWGEENELADSLSRFFSGASLPEALASVPRHGSTETWLSLGVQQVR